MPHPKSLQSGGKFATVPKITVAENDHVQRTYDYVWIARKSRHIRLDSQPEAATYLAQHPFAL